MAIHFLNLKRTLTFNINIWVNQFEKKKKKQLLKLKNK